MVYLKNWILLPTCNPKAVFGDLAFTRLADWSPTFDSTLASTGGRHRGYYLREVNKPQQTVHKMTHEILGSFPSKLGDFRKNMKPHISGPPYPESCFGFPNK